MAVEKGPSSVPVKPRYVQAVKRRSGEEGGRVQRLWQLNEEAVERDARFDGLHGVWTNLDCGAERIRRLYSDLWMIEASFRVIKHDLAVRPIFHWTEHRVRSHASICYAAFALLRMLRFRCAEAHADRPTPSEEQLLETLHGVETIMVRDRNSGRLYALPSTRRDHAAHRLYNAVGIRLPTRGTPVP